MRIVFALLAILCGLLFAIGGLAESSREKMILRARQDGRYLQIIVTLPQIDDRYVVLKVDLCSAEMTENGTFCTPDFYRSSVQELDKRRSQILIEWRDIPGRTIQITAIAYDGNARPLAAQTLAMFLKG